MAKKATQKTTRNTSFNYSKDTEKAVISSVVSTKASEQYKNIRLLGVDEAIIVKGKDIADHAAMNTTMQDLGESSNVKIKTGIADSDLDTKYYIYGAPFQQILNNRQHYNNCGVESTLNTLAMAGLFKMKSDLSDQKSLEKKFLSIMLQLGLVADEGEIGKLDEPDGGTLPDDYRDMLVKFDIDSEAYYASRKCNDTQFSDLGELGYKISCGYGAVVGVCANKLWQETEAKDETPSINHAIAITGVVYKEGTKPSYIINDDNNEITYTEPVGFYIHDTGAWMSRYISLEEFKEVTLYKYHGMLKADYEKYEDYNEADEADFDTKYQSTFYNNELRTYDSEQRQYYGKKPNGIFVTITSDPIKAEMFNLNATGDKNNNIIWGNSLDNVIKGMAGNDTLYGNEGDDEIYGGKGNDIIVGNNLSDDDKTLLSKVYKFNLENVETSEDNLLGRNVIKGDAGNDIILGGDDVDLIYGGAGDDFIWSGSGRNAVYGGKGKDVIIGGYDNDRLFGDAGDDTIYGLGDDDTIHGGAGNDTIYGGRGDDKIETGKGKDTIIFEGMEHGIDNISSQAGSTVLKFIDEKFSYVDDDKSVKTLELSKGAKITDMYFGLEKQENSSKVYDFGIRYNKDVENATDAVTFDSLFNYKTGKQKTLTIIDANEDEYKVTATKAKTIKLSSKNNVLFSIRKKGATITTTAGNDVVTMLESDKDSYDYLTRVDKITYNGGKDRYISEEGDTYYTVKGFGVDTQLSVYDNVEPVTKFQLDLEKLEEEDMDNLIKTVKVVSDGDRLNLDCSKNDFKAFFDVSCVENKAYTTDNTGLYLLNSVSKDGLISAINSSDDLKGYIYMDSFFGYDVKEDKTKEYKQIATIGEKNDFFGNGRIEKIYTTEENTLAEYATFDSNLTNIASAVASWLNSEANKTGQISAFEAFKNAGDTDISGLIAAYTHNA